jgi:hypothetical protein
MRRSRLPHPAGLALAPGTKRSVSVRLKPISIQIALLAVGLLWMLLGTAASICIYTGRLMWTYRSTAVGVSAGALARTRRFDLPAWLGRSLSRDVAFVAVCGATALGVALGWIGGDWLAGRL